MDIKTSLIQRIKKKRDAPNQTSTDVNIVRRILNVSLDLLRLISIFFYWFETIVRGVRFPLLLLNISLQMVVVIYDPNYPPPYKKAMVGLITLGALLIIGIWSIAPTLTMCLVALTIATHLITLFYRATQLHLTLQNYINQPDTVDIDETTHLLIRLILTYKSLKHPDARGDRLQAEDDIQHQLNQYCNISDSAHIKRRLFTRVIDNTIGVTVLIIRGVAAVLFLTVASCTPVLILPLLLISLACNTCDLIRNTYSKIQNWAINAYNAKRQIELIKQLENFTTEFDQVNNYEQIMQLLCHPTESTNKIENFNHCEYRTTRFFSGEKLRRMVVVKEHDPEPCEYNTEHLPASLNQNIFS